MKATDKKGYRGLLFEREEHTEVFNLTFNDDGTFSYYFSGWEKDKKWDDVTDEEIEYVIASLQKVTRNLIEQKTALKMLETTQDV